VPALVLALRVECQTSDVTHKRRAEQTTSTHFFHRAFVCVYYRWSFFLIFGGFKSQESTTPHLDITTNNTQPPTVGDI
jgi:hypothetical protein